MTDPDAREPGWAGVERGLRSGNRSVSEVIDEVLSAADDRGGALGCFVDVFHDAARRRARELDAMQRSGAPLPDLFGMPVGVKDIFATGQRTPKAGMRRPRREWANLPRTPEVTRLLEAGAVIVGATVTTEGAYAGYAPGVSAPLNPWDADAWSGASSSGSGVSVAGGLVAAAIGSDTGGSVRFPAAANGVVGMTAGYQPGGLEGCVPLAPSMDQVGVFAPSIRDAARVMDAISDRTAPGRPSTQARPRLALDELYVFDGLPSDVIEPIRAAVELLDEGCGVDRSFTMPDWRQAVDSWSTIAAYEAHRYHHAAFGDHPEDFGSELSALLKQGASVSRARYELGLSEMHDYRQALSVALGDADAVIAAVLPSRVPTVAEWAGYEHAGSATKFSAPLNLAGYATLTVPIGLDSRGMPVSIQLAAPRERRGNLAAIGAVLDRLAPSPTPTHARVRDKEITTR